MAGDWIKVEKLTPDKPEIAILARKLGISIGDAFLQWFRVYAWADGVTCPGFVPNLSLADVDQLARAMPRTAEHLASKEISWMREGADGVHFSKWDRHNGKSAKSRALEQEKKRNQRAKSDDLSRNCPDDNGTTSGLERQESDRRPSASNREWKANGSAGSSQNGESAPDGHSPHSPRSPLESSGFERQEEPFDLSEVDWDAVEGLVESLARLVRPVTEKDRRAWFRFGVLALTSFSEHWLLSSAESVLRAKQTKRTKQAHLVGVLKAKAAEQGIDEATFAAMLRRIEIPTSVWKSGVLEVRK